MDDGALQWPTWRLYFFWGTALVELLGGEVDFKVVGGFEVGLVVEFTLVLVNVKGLGGREGQGP